MPLHDAPPMLSRKRKSTVSSDPASVAVPDDAQSPVLAHSVVAAAAAAATADQVLADVSPQDLTMRERHRAASRAAPPISLQLPVVSVPVGSLSASSSFLVTPSDLPQREQKRARFEQQDNHKIIHFQSTLCSSQRGRRNCRNCRAYSLPNIHFNPTPHSHQIKSSPSSPQDRKTPLSSPTMSPTRAALQTFNSYSHPASPKHCPACHHRSSTASPLSHPQIRYSSSPLHVPSLQPLINRETLKELDLEAILRNPQLRHDLLFDAGLQFQPTTSRRKRDITKKYWIAVQRELEFGCTCTSFDTQGNLLECSCSLASSTTTPLPYSPKSPRLSLEMPSRIQPLVEELLVVLLSVISPSPSSPPSSSFPSPTSSPPTMPTTIFPHPSHSSQEAQLRATLDPHLIEQELLHGIFDPSGLFQLLGSILKCHCAPMRDHAVDAMVAIVQNCTPGKGGKLEDAVKAIRMCFEILELMKLDIANHQLLALRPYLILTSSEFELQTFQDRFGHGLISLDLTRSWLQAAYDKLLSGPPAPVHTGNQRCNSRLLSRSQQIHLAMFRALSDTIFTPTTTPKDYPETFYLDHHHLLSLSQEASDILAMYLLLMLYRQLVCTASSMNPTPRKLDDAELESIKRDIQEIGPARLGLCFAGEIPTSSAPQRQKSKSKGKEREQEQVPVLDGDRSWHHLLADVLLQLAVRATCSPGVYRSGGGSGTGGGVPVPRSQLPEKHTLEFLQGWASTNLRRGSPLSFLMSGRLKDAMVAVLIDIVLSKDQTFPRSIPAGASPVAAGLEILSTELRALGEKVANLAVCHWRVYGSLYETDRLLTP